MKSPCLTATVPPTCPPSCPPSQTLQHSTPQFNLQYTHVVRGRNISTNITKKYHDLLCQVNKNLNLTFSKNENKPHTTLNDQSNHMSSSSQPRRLNETSYPGNGISVSDSYFPYVIGITPTYFRHTQRLDLTTLCQTLMSVPRFLWIVVEDAKNSTPQVEEILAKCRVRVFVFCI